MTMQYEQNNINLERVTAVKSFIYDESSPVQNDIIYNSWTSLISVLQSIQGIKEIIIRGLSTIPPGVYDMSNIFLVGDSGGTAVITNDAVLNNLMGIHSLIVQIGTTAANTVPTFQYTDGGTHELTVFDSAFIIGINATASALFVANGSTVNITARFSTFRSSNIGVPVFWLQDLSSLEFRVPSGSNNYGGPPGAPSIFTIQAGSSVDIPSLGAGDILFRANQTNPPNIIQSPDYDPADLADWGGTNPDSIHDALDRIAAHVGPIP